MIMLRRVANHLFWAGRNLERAEWRARLVDVNYHLLIESPPRDSEPWAPLLAITGEREAFAERYTVADEASVLAFFTYDDSNPSSIRCCIRASRENTRVLRHRISSELWLELNGLHLDAQSWSLSTIEAAGVYGFFAELRGRFYRIGGVTYDTLTRDLGFDFFMLGKMLERAESVARLLDAKYHFLLPRIEDVGGPVDVLQWAALLRSASALEAYRRTYGSAIGVERVVEMLLFDGSFPRSARFCVNRLEDALKRIAEEEPVRAERVAERGCVTDRLSEALGVTAGAAIKDGLHEYLLKIQEECAAIGDAVSQEYLRFK